MPYFFMIWKDERIKNIMVIQSNLHIVQMDMKNWKFLLPRWSFTTKLSKNRIKFVFRFYQIYTISGQ